MIEIKEEDLKLMWVWACGTKRKYNRYVFAKYKNKYLAVNGERNSQEEAIKALENGGMSIVSSWPHAKPIKTKLTAVAKSAVEITGVKGIVRFAIKRDNEIMFYTEWMNDLAGKRIEIMPSQEDIYDYMGERYLWLKEWLKDFREEEVE